MIAHIRNGEIIRKYRDSAGRVTLENGDTVSPPVAGYVNGNDMIVPVVDVTIDKSKTTQTTQATVETVEADRVLRTTTVTDIPIADLREQMRCSKMQGILTLGEAKWNEVLAYRDLETTTWPEQTIIDSATDWNRTSQNIQFIGYLVGYTDEQMDELFVTAKDVVA